MVGVELVKYFIGIDLLRGTYDVVHVGEGKLHVFSVADLVGRRSVKLGWKSEDK